MFYTLIYMFYLSHFYSKHSTTLPQTTSNKIILPILIINQSMNLHRLLARGVHEIGFHILGGQFGACPFYKETVVSFIRFVIQDLRWFLHFQCLVFYYKYLGRELVQFQLRWFLGAPLDQVSGAELVILLYQVQLLKFRFALIHGVHL